MNWEDNCSNTYNPSQTDSDNDKKGDVCDTDIDNDGVSNAAGIVDDNGNLVISKFPQSEDKNIFSPNNSNNSNDGNQQPHVSVYIETEQKGNDPYNYSFAAKVEGTRESLERDFGDGTFGEGEITQHSFPGPGTYIINIYVKGKQGKAIGKATIIIPEAQKKGHGLQIQSSNLGGYNPQTLEAKVETNNSIETIERSINNTEATTLSPTQKYTKILQEPGIYTITAK